MLVGWSILDSILFYSACLTTSHLRINEHFTSCTVLLKVSRVQLFGEVLILLNHFFSATFSFTALFIDYNTCISFGWPVYWKSFCKIPCTFNKKKFHAVCIACPCGPTIHFSFLYSRITNVQFCWFFLGCNQDNDHGYNFITKKKID